MKPGNEELLGDFIRRSRLKKGYSSRKALAKVLEVSEHSVWRIEVKSYFFSRVLRKMSIVLDFDYDEIEEKYRRLPAVARKTSWGKLFYEARIERGLTQQQVADLAGGINSRIVRFIENGDGFFSMKKFRAVAEVLGIWEEVQRFSPEQIEKELEPYSRKHGKA